MTEHDPFRGTCGSTRKKDGGRILTVPIDGLKVTDALCAELFEAQVPARGNDFLQDIDALQWYDLVKPFIGSENAFGPGIGNGQGELGCCELVREGNSDGTGFNNPKIKGDSLEGIGSAKGHSVSGTDP